MDTEGGAELETLIALLDQRLAVLVGERKQAGSDPGDAFRGLYLSEEDVDRALGADGQSSLGWVEVELFEFDDLVPVVPDLCERFKWSPRGRITALMSRFGLSAVDCFLLVIAAAPDITRNYERLFAYLNDDVSHRRASIGLALELCGADDEDPLARQYLMEESPLLRSGLITIENRDAPFLHRDLRVDTDVVDFLLGGSSLDASLPLSSEEIISAITTAVSADDADRVAAMLSRGTGLVYLIDRPGSVARALGAAGFAHLEMPILSVELDHLGDDADLVDIVKRSLRTARMRGAGLLIGPIDRLVINEPGGVRLLVNADQPVVLVGNVSWDPRWSSRPPHLFQAPILDQLARRQLLGELAKFDRSDPLSDGHEEMFEQFTLRPEELARAVAYGRAQAAAFGRSLRPSDLIDGARLQNSSGLERLTRRVHPFADWDDLVVPTAVKSRLRSISQRARYRHVVIDEWGMRPGGGRGAGVVALFFGESGTGKTLAAEVIAHELGLDLYTVNLATVVDKYVGETEKNLEAIFTQAIGVNGVLFFDEADALFGKRSEGGDAHDRYANIEVAYLLQRIEAFDGLAILATNLRANMDSAFVRRIDVVVDFPMPNAAQRLALWQRYLPASFPRDDDVDLEFMARSFRLTGGAIHNICTTSAFDAYGGDGRIAMSSIVRATQRELEKLGRLCVESEFGPYFGMIETPTD